MSLTDTVSSFCSGSVAGSVNQIVQMLASHEGGVAGLTKTFRDQGLGGVLSSWLGQGENQPISAEQITRVFGNDRIAAIANKCGVSPDTASAEIAELLPAVVDKLSPHGTLPASQVLMSQASSLLSGLISKRA